MGVLLITRTFPINNLETIITKQLEEISLLFETNNFNLLIEEAKQFLNKNSHLLPFLEGMYYFYFEDKINREKLSNLLEKSWKIKENPVHW